jgi:hypothetical protein
MSWLFFNILWLEFFAVSDGLQFSPEVPPSKELQARVKRTSPLLVFPDCLAGYVATFSSATWHGLQGSSLVVWLGLQLTFLQSFWENCTFFSSLFLWFVLSAVLFLGCLWLGGTAIVRERGVTSHPLRFFVQPSVHRQNSVIVDPNLGLTSLLLLLLMCVSSLILQFVTLQPVLY